MAIRFCGELRIEVVYRDKNYYDCRVSRGRNLSSAFVVYPPEIGFGEGIAFDSARAYDRTAHAAASFACNVGEAAAELASYAMLNAEGDGWHIRRVR